MEISYKSEKLLLIYEYWILVNNYQYSADIHIPILNKQSHQVPGLNLGNSLHYECQSNGFCPGALPSLENFIYRIGSTGNQTRYILSDAHGANR